MKAITLNHLLASGCVFHNSILLPGYGLKPERMQPWSFAWNTTTGKLAAKFIAVKLGKISHKVVWDWEL